MCGITGVVAVDGGLSPEIRRAMPAMTAAIRHRGPDGGAIVDFEGAALGHRRLAIIDRAGGQQPMTNEDGSLWIVFNGEIYNHHALRRELVAAGHRFRTASDTEAILHAFEQYGPASVERLEGMFAFAIYDRRRHELFVARDRLGKKPLFWGVFGGALHFASEMKALAESPAFTDDLDLSGLEGYLSLGYVLAPRTIYRDVFKLEPAHWLSLGEGRLTIRRYWDIEAFDDDRRPAAAIADELSALVRDNVRARLESEVPLGAFLSGGIDSALVTSFMTGGSDRGVVTTSVGFGEAAHNELDAAALTARHLGTSHHPDLVTPALDEVLERIAVAFDEPFADASAIPTYYVSAMARRHVTVALSGDGGDETFAGYDFRYVPHAVESAVARLLPGVPARWAAGVLGRAWPRRARLPRWLRLARTFDNLSGDRAAAYYADLCFLKPDEAQALLGRADGRDLADSDVFQAVTAPYRRCAATSAVQRAEYADVMTYLPNDVLVKVDRMSMAHGLEVRCPLLDRRLVEFAFRVPASTKMPWLRPKALLRRAAAGRVPDAILHLPKHGFTAPVGEWLAGPSGDRFADEVLGGDAKVAALVDRDVVARWFAAHRAGRADRSFALWAVWMLERWARGRDDRRRAAPGALVEGVAS